MHVQYIYIYIYIYTVPSISIRGVTAIKMHGSVRYDTAKRKEMTEKFPFLMNSLFIKTNFFTLNNDGDMLNDYTIIL